MIFNAIFLTFLPTAVFAANDWTTPCTSGWCSYESGDGKNNAWSKLIINAENPSALSDITGAAGWEILNCDETSIDPQDIRLVCVDQSKGCSQLFKDGAESTIIRLPENCAGGPYARVSRVWDDEDQSLPPHLAKKRQTIGTVHGLALDFDFHKIPETRGRVSITVSGTNSPAQRDVLDAIAVKRSFIPVRHGNKRAQASAVIDEFVQASKRRVPPQRRGFFDSIGDAFKDVGDKVVDGAKDAIDGAKDVVDKVGDGVSDAVDTVKDGVQGAVDTVGQIVDTATGAVVDFVEAIGDGTAFNKGFEKEFDLIDINQQFPVFTTSISCPPKGNLPGLDALLSVNTTVKAQIKSHVGFILSGSIVPPQIDDLAFTGGLSGSVGSTFGITAIAKGTFATPNIVLLKQGLPGLSFPGILTLGPSLSLNALVKASLALTADITVSASLDLPQVEFVFPEGKGEGSAECAPKDSPLEIKVGGSVDLTGRVEAHIIPRIDIGVEILNGAAKATVFANIDASAGLDMGLKATVTLPPAEGSLNDPPVPDLSKAETTLGGSVGMDLGVSINVGAEADLDPFFKAGATILLFSQIFPIFDKQFPGLAIRRDVGNVLAPTEEDIRSVGALVGRQLPAVSGLICPVSAELKIDNQILRLTVGAPSLAPAPPTPSSTP